MVLHRRGSLQITGLHDNRLEVVATAHAGDSIWVPPNTWHGTLNASRHPVRFLVVGVPGVMTDYFAQTCVVVAADDSPPATSPPGPLELAAVAAHFGIAFFPNGDT
jgi:uncharacterized RmlC-like cupin family protein